MRYWTWLLNRIKRQLWWQALLYALLGIATALVATVAENYFPWSFPFDISRDAVDSLLNIIASSMLAVTTFSLGAMTSAFGAATSNVTPRATKLLMEDRVTHNVLSSFLGAFIFSIVGIIVLRTGSYGETGRSVLFIITIGIIALIVVQLMRWINHLISLGRVGTTIQMLEEATSKALTERLERPYLGCNPWHDTDNLPADTVALKSSLIGYINFINIEGLSQICEREGLQAYLPLNSGAFVYEGTPLLWLDKPVSDELTATLCDHFVLAATRSYEQDPRFGFAVLAEVGSRALSPATNDPGTAMDILTRQTRLLSQWAKGREEAPVEHPRLYLNPLKTEDLFEDAFLLMARDGAHLIEIQLRLQKSLHALQQIGNDAFRKAARQQAEIAHERAKLALQAPTDIGRIDNAMKAFNRT